MMQSHTSAQGLQKALHLKKKKLLKNVFFFKYKTNSYRRFFPNFDQKILFKAGIPAKKFGRISGQITFLVKTIHC